MVLSQALLPGCHWGDLQQHIPGRGEIGLRHRLDDMALPRPSKPSLCHPQGLCFELAPECPRSGCIGAYPSNSHKAWIGQAFHGRQEHPRPARRVPHFPPLAVTDEPLPCFRTAERVIGRHAEGSVRRTDGHEHGEMRRLLHAASSRLPPPEGQPRSWRYVCFRSPSSSESWY